MITDYELGLQRQISGLKALSHVRELAKIGYRFVGTQGDKDSIKYMKDQFKAYGLEVKETPFRTLTFEDEKPLLKILSTGEELEGVVPLFSPSTPVGGIEADAVLVGDGQEEDYKRVHVQGKIVILTEETLGYSKFWLGTFADRAARAGAVGMIFIHPMPWPYRMSMEAGNSDLENRFCERRLPAICISAVGGLKLMYALSSSNFKARMETKTLLEERESVIISGFLKGAEFPEERIGILAHRDNAIAPGANDNGSGTGTLLEIARILSKTRPKRTLELISTTGEEDATPGAWNYCHVHEADLVKNMKALLDMDMISVGSIVKQVERGEWPDCDPIIHPDWLMNMMDEVAADLGYGFGRMTAAWGVPEEGRFNQIGVPATVFWGADDPYYHSIHDTIDKVNPNSLKALGDTIAIVAWRLANQ
ncbi:MAG: M20/M25/M40 family metallo-hydrolase [Desulfatiglandaceae bacterium]